MTNFLKKARAKHKHGLFVHAVIYKLGRKGLFICPYYLVQEGTDTIDLPDFKGDIEEYTFDFIDSSDLETLQKNNEFQGKKAAFQRRLDKGYKCFCVKHRGQIVAHTWFDFEECRFLDPLFKLKENEAYLFDMYTLESYRGKNIAPFLRHKGYEALRKMEKDTFYSLTDFFNAPAVKFKKKLNANFLGLYLLIDLFRKWKWNLKIRKYKT